LGCEAQMLHQHEDNGLLPVLVPDGLGLDLGSPPDSLELIPYDLALPATDNQKRARAMVVAVPDVDSAASYMTTLPRLELVQALSAGYEQWVGRLPAGVKLANVRFVHGIGVSEWVLAVLLSHFRELPDFAASQSRGQWNWHATGTLVGKSVTILGAGDLAIRTRDLLALLHCDVTLVGRTARDGVITMESFLPRASAADVIVIALPLTPATTRVVDAEFLARLRPGAVIVNAGRGALVDTEALMRAAQAGQICGILDVVDPEPLPEGHPLWTSRGITITPHIAGAVPDVWPRSWKRAVNNLQAFAAGRDPEDLTEES
jgi:phosphoglycerate dehydrogenase-like enzyme